MKKKYIAKEVVGIPPAKIASAVTTVILHKIMKSDSKNFFGTSNPTQFEKDLAQLVDENFEFI